MDGATTFDSPLEPQVRPFLLTLHLRNLRARNQAWIAIIRRCADARFGVPKPAKPCLGNCGIGFLGWK